MIDPETTESFIDEILTRLPTQTPSPTPTAEFKKIIKEFIGDIQNTFPEYNGIIGQWWDLNAEDESVLYIYNYCMKVYPERLFEILYQNTELFSEDTNYNTEFLPGISFKYLWASNITDKTRETIWKYLQLVVISLIDTIKDKSIFGDTAKLLETIDNDEFKTKLEETLENIQTLFTKEECEGETKDDSSNTEPKFNLPSPDDIQGHISGMLQGKLGDLAKEIAEETAGSMNFDMFDEMSEPKDIFKQLFSDPSKLMDLVKNVGSKLDTKIKSGEINQTDLFTEASEMMGKMKSIPGMDNIQDIISKMGLGGKGQGSKGQRGQGQGGLEGLEGLAELAGLGQQNGKSKGTRVDQNAMDQRLKNLNTREKMRKKLEERHMNKLMNEAAAEMLNSSAVHSSPIADEELVSLFQENKKTDNPKKKKSKSVVTTTS